MHLATLPLLFAGAVATANPDDTLLVVATPQASKYTGWMFDTCGGRTLKPADQRDHQDNSGCIPTGGVLYRVRLVDIEVLRGQATASLRQIGFFAHDIHIARNSRTKYLFEIRRSPADFEKATGIAYIAYGRKEVRDVACLAPEDVSRLKLHVVAFTRGEDSCYLLGELKEAADSNEGDENK